MIRWQGRGPAGSVAPLLVAAVWAAWPPSIASAESAAASLSARIDTLVNQSQTGIPAGRASDAEFLRRLSIDLLGSIPAGDEARRFLDDRSPDKRTRLIGRLLDHPRYAVHMAHVFDVMLSERRSSDAVKQEDWQRYLFDSFAANKPYDCLVYEILAADGTDPKLRPAVKFYLERNGDSNLLTRDVARIFFGRDLQCCQCHDHPLIDHYRQSEYYGLFAFLQRGYVTADNTKEKRAYYAEKAEGLATFQSVFDRKKTKHRTRPRLPGDVEIEEPYHPIGAEYKPASVGPYPAPKYSRRARLANETIASANRSFRRNIANRLWAHMMGRGLVEPVDLDHPDNPAVNPPLLNLLADEFQAMRYDIKAFLREIAATEAYQRSCELPAAIDENVVQPTDRRRELETQQQRLLAATALLEAEIKKAEQELVPLKQAVDRLGDELLKAEAKTAEAKKAADAGAETLAKTRGELAVKTAVMQSLAEAAAKTQQAAAQLPREKALAAAAAKFQARAATMAGEAKKLAATAAQQADRASTTARLLQAAQDQSRRAARQLAAAETATAPIARRRQAAIDRHQDQLTRINSLKQAIASLKTAEACVSHRAAAAKYSRAARRAKGQHAIAQQIIAVRTPLVEAREHELALLQASFSDDERAETDAQHALTRARASLAAARQEAAGADAQLRSAETRAKSERGAADTELTTLSKDWSNRFAVASVRPLSPEQLGWNVMQALGIVSSNRAAAKAALLKAPPPVTANSAGADRLALPVEWETDRRLKAPLERFITLFGSGAGQPQHDFFATVDQALFFANGGEVRGWLAPAGGNLTERLLKTNDPKRLADELYLNVLTRRATADESAEIDRYLAARPKDRSAAVQEIVWALLTSTEFRFNH